MESDIKNLLEITNLCKEEIDSNDKNITATLDFEDLKSLRNMLERYKELEEENEKLKRTKNIALKRITDIKEGIENDFPIVLGSRQPLFEENIDKFIPISVIQNTLKEIDNRNYNDYTNNQDGNEVKNNILKDIQELLEERNK